MSKLRLLALLLVLLPARQAGSFAVGEDVVHGTVVINTTASIASTDEQFICATLDWWPQEKCDYGTCSWGRASILNLNLSSHILLNAVKAFSTLRLRLGGTLQDKVLYDTGDLGHSCKPFVQNSSAMFGFNEGCLTMSRWDQLNEFFQHARHRLSPYLRKKPDGSQGGPWNYTNAAFLINYTVTKGYNIYGWEMGNELSGSGIGARINADTYAADLFSFRTILDKIYHAQPTKPLLLAPGGFFDEHWYAEFINKATASSSLDVVTHHMYSLGAGVDEHLVERILDPSYLDGAASTFKALMSILNKVNRSTTAWVGEAGGAYNSGHNLVTNSFVSSFWYLDQLGMSAANGHKVYCRQSLIGGNYGLLNTTTFEPNPDYYSALLWHRLMGQKVLSTNFNGTKKIRAYANCARESKGITLLLLNLDSNTTALVRLGTKTTKLEVLTKARLRSNFGTQANSEAGEIREEYHLTAKNGNLHSQVMLLNGQVLEVSPQGDIPALKPSVVDYSQPIQVTPLSIVFAHIPYLTMPACQ
ncbi:hypothetical protein HPP92_010893 [Vanilla planifolia]|uniref:Heparanase-like protein 3 n=1 Tax=Vanilla planifolia TaxID=51239 RepID=A0A835QUQ3_VANPL|nr:hypothetical protein HPP92_010893 [Vanilla planifolia]